MSLKFGTDGVRGVAFEELTPELVYGLGRAAARVLGAGEPFYIGRDTRESGPPLQAALAAGLVAEGARVVDLGVMPTPGVASVCAARHAPGAVVSASHNPYRDNGIKFFARGGLKLVDDVEQRIEDHMRDLVPEAAVPETRQERDTDAAAAYEQLLLDSLEGRRLDGLSVVLDCAHGASAGIAPRVFRAAGARVTVLHDAPTGTNINDGCGSTHPEALQDAVVRVGADAGIAFDGDADRMLAVDAEGNLVDGDHILAICAVDRRERDRLVGDTVVVTVLANLGFRLAMDQHDVKVIETAVGDRYILEAMADGGWTLGGEQSGHIIFRDLATTGDGMLAGLQLLDVVARSRRSLADLATVMTRTPQVMINVREVDRGRLDDATALWALVDKESAELGGAGRVLLRKSGTEPIVRVMVEAPTEAHAHEVAQRIAVAVAEELALG